MAYKPPDFVDTIPMCIDDLIWENVQTFTEREHAEMLVSIRELGIVVPPRVTPIPDCPGKYLVIPTQGARRLTIAEELGVRFVPCEVISETPVVLYWGNR